MNRRWGTIYHMLLLHNFGLELVLLSLSHRDIDWYYLHMSVCLYFFWKFGRHGSYITNSDRAKCFKGHITPSSHFNSKQLMCDCARSVIIILLALVITLHSLLLLINWSAQFFENKQVHCIMKCVFSWEPALWLLNSQVRVMLLRRL